MMHTSRRHRLILLAVAALLTVALLAISTFYSKKRGAFLPGLTETLSEVAMKQGIRREAAGDLEGALKYYQRALAGNFQGTQNRIHVEKRCGVILSKLERYEAAIPHLMRAQNSPLRSLNGYKPLADSLLAVGRLEEATSIARTWFEATASNDDSRADAHQALGHLSLLDNDIQAAQEHFLAAIALHPDHEAWIDLARLYHGQGDTAKAMECLTSYLNATAPGEENSAVWDLLSAWR